MSLDSSFWIDAPATAKDVCGHLVRSGDFSVVSGAGNDWRLVADGVLAIVKMSAATHNYLHEVGIGANLQIYFVNSDKSKTAAWTLNSVRAVVSLLAAYPGDALFVYCSESPALMRKSGHLVLDPRAGLWVPGVEPNVLDLIQRPFSWGEIPIT